MELLHSTAFALAYAGSLITRALFIERLIGVPADAALTIGASERLTTVTSVCQLLRGTLSEAGVRRWWTKRRYQFGGLAPADLIGGGGWTTQALAFREIVALAEADAGFMAT